MKAIIEALTAQAAELSAIGAVRPDHDQRWAQFRQDLDRAAAAAETLDAAPAPIDAAAAAAAVAQLQAGMAELVARVETLAVTIDATGDAVRELANQGTPA